MIQTKGKIIYLEGIRGVAAFLVFCHHFLLAFYPAYYGFDVKATHLNGMDIAYGQSMFSVLTNGNFYVRVFFVLSGFVLSRKYFLNNEPSSLVSGAQRRFVRLYIPVATAVIIAFLLMQSGLFFNVPVSVVSHSEWWLGNMWTFQQPVKKLLECLTYSTMFFGDNSFDTCLRTMSIEFYGSMLVFAFLMLTHNTRNRATMLALSFIVCCFVHQPDMCAFILGISLNYIERRAEQLSGPVTFVIVSVLLFLAVTIGAYSPDVPPNALYRLLPTAIFAYFDWFNAIAAFCLVSCFVLSASLQHIFSFRLFRFLGFISFSLYLLHPLLIGSFSSYLFLQLYNDQGYNNSVIIVFLMTTGLCVGLSWLMAKYIDMPAVAAARYLYDKWGKTIDKTGTKRL